MFRRAETRGGQIIQMTVGKFVKKAVDPAEYEE